MLKVSYHNYPGGEALLKLHHLEHKEQSASVHIDNYAAQTGVSRFGQLYENGSRDKGVRNWSYDKTENLSLEDLLNHSNYTYLLVENKDSTKTLIDKSINYDILESVEAFAGYKIRYKDWKWPITIENRDAIFILKRKK